MKDGGEETEFVFLDSGPEMDGRQSKERAKEPTDKSGGGGRGRRGKNSGREGEGGRFTRCRWGGGDNKRRRREESLGREVRGGENEWVMIIDRVEKGRDGGIDQNEKRGDGSGNVWRDWRIG